MPEFDFYAAIKELVEVEWKCPGPQEPYHIELRCAGANCLVCGGTGCIVPFAALRVKCSLYFHSQTDLYCGGRGWIPEPDVEKACWRVMKHTALRLVSSRLGHMAIFPSGGSVHYAVPDSGWCKTEEEAVLRAALAWIKEQHDPYSSVTIP